MIAANNYYEKKELIELTQSLIKIPSHKDVENQEKKVTDFIYSFAENHGFEVQLQRVVGERSNVLIYLRGQGNGRSLMLNGHTDTIPPHDMTIDPFAGYVKDGCIWGRGATDMKGGLASMLMSMIALKRSPIILEGDVIFTGVIGEEEKSEGTEHLIKSGLKTDAAIVGEPSNYEYTIGHRGLEWLEIVVRGKAAHAGIPHMGVNAIEKAMNLIMQIKMELYPKLQKRYNKYMGNSVMNFGTIKGGDEPNTVADSVSIEIDRRYIIGEDFESILKEYQQIIDEIKKEDPEFEAEIRRNTEETASMHNPPLFTSPRKPIVKALRKSISEVINHEPEITKTRGWTDAALLSKYGKIPSVVFGPGNIHQSHTKDERISIEDLVNAVTIYTNTIQRFCGVVNK